MEREYRQVFRTYLAFSPVFKEFLWRKMKVKYNTAVTENIVHFNDISYTTELLLPMGMVWEETDLLLGIKGNKSEES